MIGNEFWLLEKNRDGTYTLTAPNDAGLFTVSLDTLEMLGRMFLDEVEDAEV